MQLVKVAGLGSIAIGILNFLIGIVFIIGWDGSAHLPGLTFESIGQVYLFTVVHFLAIIIGGAFLMMAGSEVSEQ
ncbi:MAG: hypothetical protein AAF587_35560 [Bacteroidota bacterium]